MITIENARVLFKNFSGTPSDFNRDGVKTCSIILPPDLADQLSAEGWNVRAYQRNPEEPPVFFTELAINFGGRPPMIYRVAGNTKTLLDENTIKVLDAEDIVYVDVVVSPYQWSVGAKSGIKGYVHTMYAVVEEDVFAGKYANIGM